MRARSDRRRQLACRLSGRRVALLLAVSATLATTACHQPEPRTPELVQERAKALPRDPSLLDKVEMSAPQRRKVTALWDQLEEELSVYDERRLRLVDLVVVQVRAHELEREALDAQTALLIAEYKKAIPDLVRFANRLHETLSKKQRLQLLELASGESKEEEAELSEEEKQAKKEDELEKVLDLRGGQKTRLYAALFGVALRHWGSIQQYRRAWKEAKEAFAEDDFDAGDLALFTELPVEKLAEATFDMLETALGVLADDQHETLAALIDTRMR